MMARMSSEEWAQRIVSKQLGEIVSVHDNGSESGMYDLRIGSPDSPQVAIEVVGAVNAAFTETWNTGPARGPVSVQVEGNWSVTIGEKCRNKTFRQDIEVLLQRLERRKIDILRVDSRLQYRDPELFDAFEAKGIMSASRYCKQGSGIVHRNMPGAGGAVDYDGVGVPSWLSGFLKGDVRMDVLSKLRRSGANARHAFVIAAQHGTPWPVESYFSSGVQQVPSQPADLPDPVTAAWLVPTFGPRGLYWDGGTWHAIELRSADPNA